jgi:transcriptional regulator with XRE-family HTH domain
MDVRIGARFRALRQRLGWRQDDLGHPAGVSQGLVSLVERGHLERVSLVRLRALAAALEADLSI